MEQLTLERTETLQDVMLDLGDRWWNVSYLRPLKPASYQEPNHSHAEFLSALLRSNYGPPEEPLHEDELHHVTASCDSFQAESIIFILYFILTSPARVLLAWPHTHKMFSTAHRQKTQRMFVAVIWISIFAFRRQKESFCGNPVRSNKHPLLSSWQMKMASKLLNRFVLKLAPH